MSDVPIKDRPRWWAVYDGYPALRLITDALTEDEIPAQFLRHDLVWILEDSRDMSPYNYVMTLAQAQSVGLDPRWVERQLVWQGKSDDSFVRAACARYGFKIKLVAGVWEVRNDTTPGILGRAKKPFDALVHYYKQLDGAE